MIRIEKAWIGDQNNCQNVGTVTGSGSLTFAKMWELFVLSGVASTISLLLASIIYLYKKKQNSTQTWRSLEKKVEGNWADGETNKEHEGELKVEELKKNIQPRAV